MLCSVGRRVHFVLRGSPACSLSAVEMVDNDKAAWRWRFFCCFERNLLEMEEMCVLCVREDE